jgi:hypothetical protein
MQKSPLKTISQNIIFELTLIPRGADDRQGNWWLDMTAGFYCTATKPAVKPKSLTLTSK